MPEGRERGCCIDRPMSRPHDPRMKTSRSDPETDRPERQISFLVMKKLNAVYADDPAKVEPALASAQHHALSDEVWESLA